MHGCYASDSYESKTSNYVGCTGVSRTARQTAGRQLLHRTADSEVDTGHCGSVELTVTWVLETRYSSELGTFLVLSD